MSWKIPLFKIYWDKQDLKNIYRVIRSGMNWAEGDSIKEFESKINKFIGSNYCVVFSSGTAALHAILLAYSIKSPDEVIVPSFAFIATANAPLFVGAKPIFADIEEDTLGLSPEDVVRKITRKTKAIIPIHYGGFSCKIKELREIAKKYKLILIEDVAESFGAKVEEKKLGTFGDSAIFSFCQNKIITTGEGGAAVTNSREIYEKLKLIRSHGRLETKNYFSSVEPFDYIRLGFNFRMPTCIASLGISQLDKVDNIIKMRINNATYLRNKFEEDNGMYVEPIPKAKDANFNVYQMFTVKVNKNRDQLMRYLSKNGIMTKIYFDPIHLTHFYKRVLKQNCKLPITERISKQVLTLPMYPTLKKIEMDYIVQKIKKFFRR
jgi:perosamine synthetase